MFVFKERTHRTWPLIVLLATLCACQPSAERKPFAKVQFRGRTGWMLGSFDYASGDNGLNWRKMFPATGNRDDTKLVYPISLIDEKVGVCVRDGYLMITTDGGVNWRQSNRTDRFLTEPFFMIEPSGLAFSRNYKLEGNKGCQSFKIQKSPATTV